MLEQESITGGSSGIWRRLMAGGAINHGAWLRARAEGQRIGECPRCGSYLTADAPYERADGQHDYVAACRDKEECRYEMVAPHGKVLQGSALKSRRKKG